MLTFLTIFYVVVCLFLIIVVLLQSGKAADLAGAFGGMGSQTAFGPRGAATILSKATTIAAILFMLLSVWLGIERSRVEGSGQSVVERTGTAAEGAAAPGPVIPVTPEQLGADIEVQGAAGTEIEVITPGEESAADPAPQP